jgi:hypothetical protein
MGGERVNILGFSAVARSAGQVWRDHRCIVSFLVGRRVVHRGSQTSDRGIIVSPKLTILSLLRAIASVPVSARGAA